jgi:aryl-alcohol dehydrogenase-like predicted oxidoreductase
VSEPPTACPETTASRKSGDGVHEATGSPRSLFAFAVDQRTRGSLRGSPATRRRSTSTRLAETKGIRVTQLALAWLLAQGDDIDARGMR